MKRKAKSSKSNENVNKPKPQSKAKVCSKSKEHVKIKISLKQETDSKAIEKDEKQNTHLKPLKIQFSVLKNKAGEDFGQDVKKYSAQILKQTKSESISGESNNGSGRPVRKRKKSWILTCDDVYVKTAETKNKFENKALSSKRNIRPTKSKQSRHNNEQIKKKNEKEKSLRKKRNNERRKEKSRDAARCRRGKESEIFAELGALLPLDSPLGTALDKASVIRVAIAYLRTRSLVTWGLEVSSSGARFGCDGVVKGVLPERGKGGCAEEMLGALDGFLIVLTKEGDIVYTSENISTFLGLSQMDIMGHSLLDYTHPCDHEEVRHLASRVKGGPNNAFLRFKCTLSPKGRSVNLKSATYKVVQMTGEVLRSKDVSGTIPEGLPCRPEGPWVVALGVPVPHPSNIEIPLDKQIFVSKHSLDMRFTYVDETISQFCGYHPEELLGKSLYQLNHALDTQLVREAYKILRSKGQVETGRYRFLSHGGGYVWVVTQATLITGPRDNKPQFVVCLNYVISKTECKGVIFSECQLQAANANAKQQQQLDTCPVPVPVSQLSSAGAVPLALPSPSIVPLQNLTPPQPAAAPLLRPTPNKPSPVTATCSLLRDRTEDMNEGYLTFADNSSHIILKEEPEDLTHLAPSVGDDCVPLGGPIYLPGLDDFLQTQSDFPLKGEIVEESLERLLSDTPIINSARVTSKKELSLSRDSSARPSPSSSPGQSLRVERNQKFIQELIPEQARVPDRDVTSPGSDCGSSSRRFNTPEPPLSPLLSQSASPLNPETFSKASSCGPRATAATTKLFTVPNVASGASEKMDFFSTLDLKLEEDLELGLRAPYIPPIDEALVLDQDELFGLSGLGYHSGTRDESTYGVCKQKSDISNLNNFSPSNAGCFSPQHSFQQTKMGADTGGSFVDPNQVLPGQFYSKGDEKNNLQELRHLLESPPPSPVLESVDPPPPLNRSSSLSHMSLKGLLKRSSSPIQVTSTKRLRPSNYSLISSVCLKREPDNERPPPTSHRRELLTPNAPLMQQLLVSKDPICVRGHVLSTPTPTTSGSGRSKKPTAPDQSHTRTHTHSVLRNLLVSGRDERAGYTVFMSSMSTENEQGKTLDGNKSDEDSSLSPDSSLHSFPLNKKGKVELTRQQFTTLLDRAGVLRPTFRVLQRGDAFASNQHDDEEPSPRDCTSSTPTLSGSSVKERQPLLSMDSNFTTIPTLFDLTSFDCEVNAPASDPSLLQGSELLMALEQTQ